MKILEQFLPPQRLQMIRAALDHVGLVAPATGRGAGALHDLRGGGAPRDELYAVFPLERRAEGLAVGDRHGAVEHDLPLLLRAFDQALVPVGALVHVDVTGGRRLGEGGGPKAGERDGEAGATRHYPDITVDIITAAKRA